MDIRGSGNLLSDEQSGHIRDTGVELYQQMLVQTIEDLKNNPDFKIDETPQNYDQEITIKLGISLLIPQDYISELSLRMSFYKKISNLKSDNEQENLINEMSDRFGNIPREVYNLFAIAKIKNICQKIAINHLEFCKDGISVGFKNNNFQNPQALLEMVMNSKDSIKINNQQRLKFITNDICDEQLKINKVFEILKKLNNLCQIKT
jgi:transcription-repair coupling factor (superfamily II helicase)